MHILITGATGYLGSALTQHLLNDGHEISILRRPNSESKRLSSVLNKIATFDADTDKLKAPFCQSTPIDLIIHCATNYGRHSEGDGTILQTNVSFPLELLNLAIRKRVKAFINIDTVLPALHNRYSLTKHQFAQWAKLVARQSEIKFVNIKMHNVYGPRDDKEKFSSWIINECINNTKVIDLTDGTQERDFIYIYDVISALRLIVNYYRESKGQWIEFIVGSGKPVSVREFAETVHRITSSQSVLNFGALKNRTDENVFENYDIGPLLNLGWNPQVDLESGIRLSIGWGSNNFDNEKPGNISFSQSG
ncbi:MAG: NAD(P)-dependent oxidoreductase [Micrococcales bacterium]|nr:NAD(P)-dependent oxidoreductase [Micrococcales bacterium]